MLVSLLIVPLIGSLLLLLIPASANPRQGEEKMKVIALSTSLVNLFISILLWIQFDSSISDYQFIYAPAVGGGELSFCHFNIGIDGISLYYVLLTTFITPIALLSNYKNISPSPAGGEGVKYFLISFLILETLQIALFVVLDLFLFYVFFESVLPILFIIIIVYGSGVNRIRSALLFFLYTLAGSLFMLLAILQIYSYVGSTDFQFISLNEISLESQKILWLSLSFSKRDMTNRLIHSSNSTLNTGCKSLVPYMSPYSLGSTLKYKRFSSKLRPLCQIPVHLESMILGVLFKDGWLYKNPRPSSEPSVPGQATPG